MKQPEALRIAELLESPGYGYSTTPAQCAAELRRLHEANQAMLEALKHASGELYRVSCYCNTYEVLGFVNDAIAKGEQQ